MTSDAELLRRYAEEESEDAFAELVGRHLNLVYFAALRQVGDPHRAKDVTQAVFTDLASKAAALWRRPVLASWLHTSTRFAAAKTRRAEQRRRRHEQEAEAMNALLRDEAAAGDWERLRPLIDEVIHELHDRDCEAVLLRFFEDRPFADIGVALDLSEDAARMRVERALEKLHALLARRGVTSTSAALAVVLANQGALAAPAGLAVSVTGAALAGCAGGGATTALATFASANKIPLGVLAAISGVGLLNLVHQRVNEHLRGEVVTMTQENRSLEPLRTENRRLRLAAAALAAPSPDTDELARLRTRAGELKQQLAINEVLLRVGRRTITRATAPEQALEIMYPGGLSSPMRAWRPTACNTCAPGRRCFSPHCALMMITWFRTYPGSNSPSKTGRGPLPFMPK